MTKLLILFFLTSCATFQKSIVERDLRKSSKKICLSAVGKGRLNIKGKKNIFGYESALDGDGHAWELALNFPLHKTEHFNLDWSTGKVKFKTSLEEKILKENADVDPKSIERFTSAIGRLLEEAINYQLDQVKEETHFNWTVTGKSIEAKSCDDNINAVFTNLIDNQYFGLMSISYTESEVIEYKMDLIVRNCLQKKH